MFRALREAVQCRQEWRRSLRFTKRLDSDTVRGWYESLPLDQRALVDAALPEDGSAEPWWGLIELAWLA